MAEQYKKGSGTGRGGWRGGGRPKGSRTKRTEQFGRAITPEEKQFLNEQLEKYRKTHSESI